MNFQQLEYIIALANEQHFAKAAKKCFVTQPTLSMMVQRLEEELGTMIFDRSKHPIKATSQGQRIVEQAKIILNQRNQLIELIKAEKNALEGELTIGIIPTLAPYLLPLFIDDFVKTYPDIQLRIEEANTAVIIEKLQSDYFDIGLLATPLEIENIIELPLFYERFFLYTNNIPTKQYIVAEDIDLTQLLLLEEGHCLRSQVLNLCELREQTKKGFTYKIGSLETLKRLVEKNQGMTILPELAVRELTKKQKENIANFVAPEPVREISIVHHKSFIKNSMLNCLKKEIINAIPRALLKNPNDNLMRI